MRSGSSSNPVHNQPDIRNPDVARLEKRIVGWLIGAVIGCSLALAMDSLVFHPVWKIQDQAPANPAPTSPVPELPPPVGSREETSSPTPPPVPAPMPMPNPIRHEMIHRLRVRGLDATPAGLVKAVAESGTYEIGMILDSDVSPDATDSNGVPALLLACEQRRLPVAFQLLEAGANPDASNALRGDGRTPLMVAAEQGDIALMECLLQHCASIDAADAHGCTALDHAVLWRLPQAVQWLIDQGASVVENDARVRQDSLYTWNPAIIAPVLERERHSRTVLWDTPARDALYAAIHIADKPMLQLLLRGHDVPPTPAGFRQPLLGYLVAWNYQNAFRLMLECGADPNTPLGSPVEKAFAKLMPDENTRFYVEKEPGMTVLMLAAGMGQLDFVQELLQYGAKRGLVSRHYRMAAVQFAARAHHPETIQMLLGKSPRPEDQHVRIDISLSRQRAMLLKEDRVVFSAPISTGRAGFPTPSGRYVVTDKERNRYSSIYKVSMPYFMRLSCSEFGMHAGVVPNYPASHGCIRLPPEAAVWFYRAADLGTLVTIQP